MVLVAVTQPGRQAVIVTVVATVVVTVINPVAWLNVASPSVTVADHVKA